MNKKLLSSIIAITMLLTVNPVIAGLEYRFYNDGTNEIVENTTPTILFRQMESSISPVVKMQDNGGGDGNILQIYTYGTNKEGVIQSNPTGKNNTGFKSNGKDILPTGVMVVDGVKYTKNRQGIQNAIDALPTEGGVVEMTCGTYPMDSYVLIVKSNVILRGQGDCTKLYLNDEANSDVVRIGDAVIVVNNVQLLDFAIDGNKEHQTGTCVGDGCTRNLIRFRSDAQNSYGAVVDGVHTYNGIQNGISIESHAFITVRNSISENNNNFGVWVENGSNISIGDGTWTRNNAMAGIKALYVSGLNIVGVNSKGDLGSGISLQNVSSSTITGNVIYRAGWTSTTTYVANGISLSSATSVVVSGNSVYGAYGNGLVMYNSKKCVITGNTFRRNGQYADATYSDIYFNSSGADRNVNNIISNNTFENDTAPYYGNRTKYNIGANATGHSNLITDNIYGNPTLQQIME